MPVALNIIECYLLFDIPLLNIFRFISYPLTVIFTLSDRFLSLRGSYSVRRDNKLLLLTFTNKHFPIYSIPTLYIYFFSILRPLFHKYFFALPICYSTGMLNCFFTFNPVISDSNKPVL